MVRGKLSMPVEEFVPVVTPDRDWDDPLLLGCRGYHKILSSYERYLNEPIKEVIFHDPATIVYWNDGSKTVVKCCEDEPFDPEKGLAMAIVKKVFGNGYEFHQVFNKWLPKEEDRLPNEYEEDIHYSLYDIANNIRKALTPNKEVI